MLRGFSERERLSACKHLSNLGHDDDRQAVSKDSPAHVVLPAEGFPKKQQIQPPE